MPLTSQFVMGRDRLLFKHVMRFNILVLLEDSDRHVFAVDGVLGDDDFLICF